MLMGETPDRPPLYELIRNDAVIEHFTGETLTVENGEELIYRTFPLAVDTTRPGLKTPSEVLESTLDDGRRYVQHRWTSWIEKVNYDSSEDYAEKKRQALKAPWDWNSDDVERQQKHLENHRKMQSRLGEDFFLWCGGPAVGLMGVIGEVGLEQFCYYLSDCPDVIYEQLERNAVKSVQWCENLPDDHGIVAVFSGDDVAYKGGPLLSPKWFEEHYMERLSRVIGAYHYRGIKLNFHSDGDLMPIMEGLVDAGIDCLNPIETIAGMDIKEIHRRFPHLVFTGGIDVSQLLPYGSPADVRDEVNRAIQDSGGQIMIGSSTELQFTVPLENFLAMRDTVLEMLS